MDLAEQVLEPFAQFRVHAGAGGTGAEEGIEPFVIPREQHRLGGILQPGDVQADGLLLADPVQAADALLQHVGMAGQVEQHQMMGELEVAPLAADLRADQRLGAFLGIGEPGGGAIPLEQAHALVEGGHAQPLALAQDLFQIHRRLRIGADHQHLFAPQGAQGPDQKAHAGIASPPR